MCRPNANSNQRFLTQEAARAAGFEVLGLLNEPSAAAVEFACRNSKDRKNPAQRRTAWYMTWAAELSTCRLSIWPKHERSVIASDGIPDLGGDDFDEILALLALSEAGKPGANRGVAYRARSGTCCLTNAAKRRNRSIPTAASSPSIWSGFEKVGGKYPSAWKHSTNAAVLWWNGPAQ